MGRDKQSNLINLLPAFDNTRDTRFFFESSQHAEALGRLVYIAKDRSMGMGMLTGEIGSGKTITRTVLANRLNPTEYKIVTLENSLLGFDDILLEIISQIRGERVQALSFPDRYSRISEYKRLIVGTVANTGRHLLIIVDEAQQLSSTALDDLKGLSNICSERENYSTIILIGQPELRSSVKSLPQVDQRISLRFHLNAIASEEVENYLVHRMKIAGCQGRLPFTRQAAQLISRASEGIPRNINRISKLALTYCESQGLSRVSEDVVSLVVEDLNDHSANRNPVYLFG